MMESDKLKEICSHFEIDTKIEPYGNGHINIHISKFTVKIIISSDAVHN